MAKSWKSRKKSRRTVSSRQRYARTLRCEHLEDRRLLAVVTVDTDQDIVDFNDGVTSLREAIFATNLVDGADEIVFDFGQDGPATILLTQGELAITDDLTITGDGAELLTIDASGNDPTPDENNGDGSRVFNIDDGDFNNLINVTLAGVTLTGGDISSGNTPGNGGAIFSLEKLSIISSTLVDNSSYRGGAVSNGDGLDFLREDRALLTIVDSRIIGNQSRSGGGIFSLAAMKITGSTISDNQSRLSGGGIFARSDFRVNQDLEIVESTISNNIAGDRGGGILTSGIGSRIDSSTIDNNTGRTGGGVFVLGSVEIVNSTVSRNTSIKTGGGGVFSRSGDLILRHVTVTDNDSKEGGSIYANSFNPGQVTTLDHVIVAGNRNERGGSPDLFGRSLAVSYSLIGDNTGLILPDAPVGLPDANGNLIGGEMYGVIDPMLGELADNGGPTQTHVLLSGSPAINRGDLNAVAGIDGVPKFDQRGDGFDRVFGGRIDIGAYEVQELSDLNLLVDTLDDESDGDFSRGDLSLREAIELANANPVADTINFDTTLTGGTILLTQGELAITDSVEIIGLGAELLTIDASGNDPTPDENNGDGSRVFNIDDGDNANLIDIEIANLTLTGGDISRSGGAIYVRENLLIDSVVFHENSAYLNGGGIYYLYLNDSTMTIVSSIFTGNSAVIGGGISAHATSFSNSSTIEIVSSTFSGNSANLGGGLSAKMVQKSAITIQSTTFSGNSVGGGSSGGGGILALLHQQATLTINSSAFTGNIASSAGFGGAGLKINAVDSGSATINDSTISGNEARFSEGGGLYARIHGSSTLAINNSTISDNSAKVGMGGGIWGRTAGSSTITINSSTISGNSAGFDGGGIYFSGIGLAVADSTIANNTADASNDGNGIGGGVFVSEGLLDLDHTIVAGNDDNSGAAPDIAGIVSSSYSLIGSGAEFLGPLANNGGPTQTHALLPGSPAIDAGDPNVVDTPEFDQRGNPFARIVGRRIDIGAYESQPLPGDFDGDRDSDADDLIRWQSDYGGEGGTNGTDFLNWQRTLGVDLSPAASQVAVASAAIVVESESVAAVTNNGALRLAAVDLAIAVEQSSTNSKTDRRALDPWATYKASRALQVEVDFAGHSRHDHTGSRRHHPAASRIAKVFAEDSSLAKEAPEESHNELLALDEFFDQFNASSRQSRRNH